jgi:hypothetical protein
LEIATHCAVAGHDDPAGGERHAGGFGARQGGQLALHGLGDAVAHPGVRGQEDHLRVRAVFRLRQQVGGDKVRVAPLSAITSTSDGPAGMSMAAPSRRWLTWRLASVT